MKDKVLHAGAGLLVGLLSGAAAGAPPAGFVVALLVGVSKEYYDYLTNKRLEAQGLAPRHTVDLLDAAATAAGGLGAALLLSMVL